METPHEASHKPPHKRLSILMPVYNGARFLVPAIESVLDQSYRDFEFLIIDDASQDETPAILAQQRDPRIRILTNARNHGIAHSLNHALPVASGRYIARMDADDLSLPERLARQVAFLDQHPDVGIVGTGAYVINEQGEALHINHPLATTDGALRWLNLFGNPFIHPSVMMRRECLEAVGGYDPAFTSAQDRDLWDRLLAVTQGANLPDILLRLRTHTQNVSVTKGEEQARNSTLVTQRALSALLDTPVDFELCAATAFANPSTPDGAASSSALLTRIYRTFTIKHNLLPSEAHFVRWEYAHRLFRMARRWPRDPQMCSVILRAVVADPTLMLEWLNRQMGRQPDVRKNIQKSGG